MVAGGNAGGRPEVAQGRMALGFDLLFLTRGIPVVYYGDEQGFAGVGGDKDARQDMFASLTPEYVDQQTIGSEATPGDDNFDPDHPLYQRVVLLQGLRNEHPVFATGAQIVHPPQGPVFSFSRIDRAQRVEYLVVTNNASVSVPATVVALSRQTRFEPLLGSSGLIESDPDGSVSIDLDPFSTVVLRAEAPLPIEPTPPTVGITRPIAGAEIPSPRYRIEAQVDDGRYAEVTFSIRVDGSSPRLLGTDDAPPYRMYWSNAELDTGTSVELFAAVDDGSGNVSSDSVQVTLGDRG